MAMMQVVLMLLQEYKSMDATSMKGFGVFNAVRPETQRLRLPVRGILAMPGQSRIGAGRTDDGLALVGIPTLKGLGSWLRHGVGFIPQ